MDTQENVSKHSLQEVQEHFKISRSKLYKTLKEQGIVPTKEGRKSYISNTCLTQLQDALGKTGTDTKKNTGTNTGAENTRFIESLQEQIEREREKNSQLEEENKQLIREVGQWQGVAKTLEQQNQKLLEFSPPEQPEEEIEEAQIVEVEEPTPKKKGWFSSLFR